MAAIQDDEFIRKYTKYEEDAALAYIERFAKTRQELREMIDSLIRQRHALHSAEIERLEDEAQRLLGRLNAVNLEALLTELECFKEILNLQKLLLEKHDAK